MMEGNLKGARYSLSSNSLSNRYSVASSKGGPGTRITPGHSRAVSEASVPSPIPPLPIIRPQSTLPKRASSALGTFGPNLQVLDRSGSLRGARSQEAMRENRLKHWIMDERDRTASNPVDMPRSASAIDHRPTSAHRVSPTPSEMRRPGSQASSIRAQMNELKGRIHEIKERSKRTSSVGKRTPSPQEQDAQQGMYKSSPPTISHTTGPGPTIEDDGDEDYDEDWLGASEYNGEDNPGSAETTDYEESHYEDAEETLDDLEGTLDDSGLGIYQHHQGDPLVLDGVMEEEELDQFDGQSETGATEYYEADQVVAGRHEDRFDAFDYSNMVSLWEPGGDSSTNSSNSSFTVQCLRHMQDATATALRVVSRPRDQLVRCALYMRKRLYLLTTMISNQKRHLQRTLHPTPLLRCMIAR
jgi:hypothetical protein